MTDSRIWTPGQTPNRDPAEILGPGSTVFIAPVAFGYFTLPPGDAHGREVVPAVELEFETLRELAIAAQVTRLPVEVANAGVTSGMGTSAEDFDEFPDGPKLLVEVEGVTYLVGPLKGAPIDWYPRLMDGFALVFESKIINGRRPCIVTNPLFQGEHVPEPPARPVPAPALPGRNDPCHCDSGKKFKHCHGA